MAQITHVIKSYPQELPHSHRKKKEENMNNSSLTPSTHMHVISTNNLQ